MTLLLSARSELTTGRLVATHQKGFYDEPRIRMDGRRDVDLDGDRLTGSSPAGRRD